MKTRIIALALAVTALAGCTGTASNCTYLNSIGIPCTVPQDDGVLDPQTEAERQEEHDGMTAEQRQAQRDSASERQARN